MKIAVISNSIAWGGLEMNTIRLAGWLQEAGQETFIVCPKQSIIEKESKKSDLSVLSFSAVTLKRYNLSGFYKIYKQLQKQGIKYLIVGHSKDIELGIIIKLFSRSIIKVVYLQQMRMGVSKRDIWHTYFYNHLNAWIAPLTYLKEELLERTRIKASKIVVIPLCIDTTRFTNAPSLQEARSFFELPSGVLIAGIIGRIDDGKGQEYLIKALATLQQKGHNLHILLMGDETKGREGTYLPYLKNLAKDLHLENRIHFRPHHANTPLAYKALDIFVMASLEETYGMVTIEAMASGLPVIGTNNYGTRELITDGQTGLYCLPKDAVSIESALEKLLNDVPFRQTLAQNAQKEAINKYHYSIQVRAIIELLESF